MARHVPIRRGRDRRCCAVERPSRTRKGTPLRHSTTAPTRSTLGVIAALALVLAACTGGSDGSPSAAQSGSTGEIVEITVGTDTGTDLLFDPGEITVAAGATVRLTFVNRATIPHNLVFADTINASTAETVEPGAQETIEFVAPEAGEYTFVCTLHPGMEGTLIVEDA